MSVSFKLFQVDATSLPEHVEVDFFNRIDVSNISDYGYIGIHKTLAYMLPLLQPPSVNPHATLITLFMNAVQETITDDEERLQPQSPATRRLLRYLPLNPATLSPYDPQKIKFIAASDQVMDYNRIFDRYCKELNFNKAANAIGAAVKQNHTVIEKWPYRLKLRPGQPGAQEEFDRALTAGVSSKECYVEWRRTRDTVF